MDDTRYAWSYRHGWQVWGKGIRALSLSVSLKPGRTRELILDLTMTAGPEDGPPPEARVLRAVGGRTFTRRVDEDRAVDRQSPAVDERLDGGEAAAVVPAGRVRAGAGAVVGGIVGGLVGALRGLVGANYTLVLLSTIGIAIAQPFFLNAWTKVPANWFSINERATAVGLVTLANLVGTALASVPSASRSSASTVRGNGSRSGR